MQPERPHEPEAEGDGGPRHPQLRRGPGPQAGAVADGERAAPVRAAAAAAAGAHLDPRGPRRHGLRPRAGHARRQGPPQGRPARRADQGPARRGGLRRRLRQVLRAGQGRVQRDRARSRARPRGPLRHRRARGLHALRGAERDPAAGPQPRQAGRHPRLLQPRGPRPAVQPAPGGQQDRPGRDDRGDRALQGEPGQPGREGNRVQIETDHLSYAGSPGQISQQQGTKVDADLSVAEQEALLGWLNDAEEDAADESGTRAPRTTPRRCAAGSPVSSPGCPRRSSATWRRCSRWSSGSSSRASGPSPRSTGSASTSGWSWRSRCAGSRTRCTAG